MTTTNTDTDTSPSVTINPGSNNPTEFTQSSTLVTLDNGGAPTAGPSLSANINGMDVAQQVNITIAIDTSGSTRGSSGTDFDGDGRNENILDGELYAAEELFDAYVAAGYNPEDINISLVGYDSGSEYYGSFNLNERDEFIEALEDIRDEGPGGTTNYVAGLNQINNAFTQAGAEASDTNVVVFLSDGYPYPWGQGPGIQQGRVDLENDWNASITGIGVGANSSLSSLNLLDNTGGATQVLSGADLLAEIVAPLTDADFLQFEIELTGIGLDGQVLTETIVLPENDPNVISTQLGWSFSNLPVAQNFLPGSSIEVTVNGIFGPDPSNPSGGNQSLTTAHSVIVLVCFTPGTMILTPRGEVAVEDLCEGDRVITRDHGIQTLRWTGSSTISAARLARHPELRPIVLCKDALGKDQPARDMRVSRQHRILVRDWRAELMFGDPEGVLAPAHSLCNDNSIIVDRGAEDVTYIHLAFDAHEMIYADGLETESFHPATRSVNGMDHAQRAELFSIFPELEQEAGFAYAASRIELRAQDARVFS